MDGGCACVLDCQGVSGVQVVLAGAQRGAACVGSLPHTRLLPDSACRRLHPLDAVEMTLIQPLPPSQTNPTPHPTCHIHISRAQVDPLDGTTNFVHSYPFTCVSIGLAVQQQPVVGVVYNPMLGELFCAAKGCGAFLNDQPIRVSDTRGEQCRVCLAEALLQTHCQQLLLLLLLLCVRTLPRAVAVAHASFRCAVSCAELNRGLFATEVGTMRSPETVAAVFDRIQTLTAAMRR